MNNGPLTDVEKAELILKGYCAECFSHKDAHHGTACSHNPLSSMTVSFAEYKKIMNEIINAK